MPTGKAINVIKDDFIGIVDRLYFEQGKEAIQHALDVISNYKFYAIQARIAIKQID
ncbi:hypothetical protein [Aquimarina sp. U1-2]|uniref:hypothetical protein n=1 Tax=Aquimarina sp. U1-2 TaxID=2823141 RepID=UPI001AEC731A|nr:hypothetical protein [Aquimarina sp. U1-2]